MMCVTLSFVAGGSKASCDSRGRTGASLNREQLSLRDYATRLYNSARRLGPKSSGSGQKIVDATAWIYELHASLSGLEAIPYASSKKHVAPAGLGCTKAHGGTADEYDLPVAVKSFDPSPFLRGKALDAFQNPACRILPVSRQVRVPKMRPLMSKAEYVKLIRRWDAIDRLIIAFDADICVSDVAEIFGIVKSEATPTQPRVLRQIINHSCRNAIQEPLRGWCKYLPHAVLLEALHLGRNQVMLGSLCDLRNYFHGIRCPLARALTCPVGPRLLARDLQGFAARAPGFADKDWVRCCYSGLPQGNADAPDIAQEAHCRLLIAYGCLRADETLVYRRPLPRAPLGHVEGVIQDDHLQAQTFPRSSWQRDRLDTRIARRDLEVFQNAQRAYRENNLEVHEKKLIWREAVFEGWGAEVEGVEGLLGPPLRKLIPVMNSALLLAGAGAASDQILATVNGLWAYFCQFRRPMFSMLDQVYRASSPSGDPVAPFIISDVLRDELLCLSVLGMFCICDLTAEWLDTTFQTDASPFGYGVVQAKVPAALSAELWRRCDRAGFHSKLLRPIQAQMRSNGYDVDMSDSESESDLEDHHVWDALPSGPYFSAGDPELDHRALCAHNDLVRRGKLFGPILGSVSVSL
jgi:hypothetical protein